MSQSKQRCPKRRARAKFLRKRTIRQPRHSSAPILKPPVSPCIQSRPVCSQPSGFLSVTGVAKPLLTAALYLYGWCQKSVALFFRIIKNVAFPSYACLQELNVLKERLEKLETEFARLQSTVQKGTAAPSSEKPSSQSSENPALALPSHVQLALVGPGSSPPQPPVPPTAPPPPPPPPLPPPRPPPAPLCLKRTGGAKTQADSLKTDAPVQITLQDLLNVKLKKTQSGMGVDKKGSPFEKHKALITLSDLQSVNLKSKVPRPPAHIINHLITPGRSGLNFRKHLKKVAIERSPGGTPITNKENVETGTGLTPIMTQALRRKFQLAHPKSPSPARLPTGSSFEEHN
ncbi:proline-rich protein 11 [Elgaria multicarinata webbii]|uniref:proline-rich protein 11 n=1 Tax=Elgaria multicarinata webbii TaxID=159646 RepID=UPI002FCD4574